MSREGIRNRIIRSMVTHNDKVPDFVEEGERFVVPSVEIIKS